LSATAVGTVALAQKSQDRIRALFCSKKTTAEQLIANAEIGMFPCRAVVPITRALDKPADTSPTNMRSPHMNGDLAVGYLSEHQFLLPHLDLSLSVSARPLARNIELRLKTFQG
jgi:hypothetical protein